MTTKLGKLTLLDWVDSCSAGGGTIWKNRDDVSEMTASECRTVGWIIREDKKQIVVASQVSTSQLGGDMCIPKSAIVRRHTLSEPKSKRK